MSNQLLFTITTVGRGQGPIYSVGRVPLLWFISFYLDSWFCLCVASYKLCVGHVPLVLLVSVFCFQGSEEIQGLTLCEWANFRTEAFAKMKRLRFLRLIGGVRLSGDYKYLSNNLRWLCWRGFPLKFIPEDFNLGKIVAIHLMYSNLTHLWEDSRVY